MYFTNENIIKHKNDTFSEVIFWDVDKKNIDIQKMKDYITERVIHIGRDEDFYALFNNYGGIEGVRNIIKNLKYIDRDDIGYICAMFELKEEELACLKEKSYKMELMHCLKK